MKKKKEIPRKNKTIKEGIIKKKTSYIRREILGERIENRLEKSKGSE